METNNAQIIKMNNGISVFLINRNGYKQKTVVGAIPWGAADTNLMSDKVLYKLPYGTAHFLEHTIFYKKTGYTGDDFINLGAYANAFTEFHKTLYFASTYKDLSEITDLVLKTMLEPPALDNEDIEKERAIISEEIRKDDGEIFSVCTENLLKGMYGETSIATPIIGTLNSISKINKEMLITCFNAFYKPQNLNLMIFADLKREPKIEIILRKICEFYPRNSLVSCEVEKEKQNSKSVFQNKVIHRYSKGKVVRAAVGFKDPVSFSGTREFLKRNIAVIVLSDILCSSSSFFYNDLYCNSILASHFYKIKSFYGDDYGYFYFICELDRYKEIDKSLVGLRKCNISENDFELARRKITGRYLMGIDSSYFFSIAFTDMIFKGIDYSEFISVINELSLKDLKEAQRDIFDISQITISLDIPQEIDLT